MLRIVLAISLSASLVGLTACNDATSDDNNDSNVATNNTTNNASNNSTANNGMLQAPYDDCTVTVGPSESMEENYNEVQGALLGASEGDVICLVDGEYTFDSMLSLTESGVEIRGQSRDNTILDFSEQVSGANGLLVQSDDFSISAITIRNAAGDGIRVDEADGVTFSDIRVEWTGGPSEDNGAYGIYPVQCSNVLVENSIISGASDAGIYVGQSETILVTGNEVFGNVAGIEIENSTDAEVVDNYAHDNTGGILVFNLPSPPVQGGKRAKVHNNRIINNNEPNFAASGNIVANVPTGTGILVLASSENEFHDNTIEGNQSLGIAIISYQTFGEVPEDKPEFSPYSEKNWVHGNTFIDNGTDPQGQARLIAAGAGADPVEPMLWDGYVDSEATVDEVRNCFQNNVDGMGNPAGYRNFDLPGTFQNQSTDLTMVDCSWDSVSTVDL